MSFGDSWFAGTHTQNKGKTSTRRNINTQKTSSCVTLARWAHLTKKTNVQSPGTDIHKMGPTWQCLGREAAPRGQPNHWFGRNIPEAVQVHFGGKILLILLKAVPSVSISNSGGNRPLWAIKGASLTPSTHTTKLSNSSSLS